MLMVVRIALLCCIVLAAMPTPAAATSCVPSFAAGDLLVVRFAPALDPGSADLIDLLVNADSADLCGLEVTDGEGSFRFQSLPAIRGDLIRLQSAAELVTPQDDRVKHVLVLGETPLLSTGKGFALAKGGDSIAVRSGTTIVDRVLYGKNNETGTGWNGEPVEATRIERRIFLRAADANGPLDSDGAAEWTFPRVYRQHQVDRATHWYHVPGEVRAFLCPDRCHEEVIARIEAATQRIDVNLYDLSLREAIEALLAAAERGVTVRLLVHERPVGASDAAMDRIAWGVDRLRDAGADVRTLERLRFDVNHAKYLVVDGTWSVVLSENANAHGWPPNGADGNRGWGVAVADAPLAAWMAALFDSDFLHETDAFAVTGPDLHADLQPPVWPPASQLVGERVPTLSVTDARVMPVVAPDHLGHPATSPLVLALDAAQSSVWFQQLNLPLEWSRPGYRTDSPLIDAALTAAERGVDVQGVLARAFEDDDPATPGNDRTSAVLNDVLGAPVVHLGKAPHGGLVHNKGWLVDPVPGGRNLAVVGSANGNLASQAMNREVTLFIEHPDVAAFFRAALADDIARAAPQGDLPPTAPAMDLPAPPAMWILALCLVLGLVRRRSLDMSSAPGPAQRP